MLRFLAIIFIAIICVGTAPGGLVAGAILCVGWLCWKPIPSAKGSLWTAGQLLNVTDTRKSLSSAIPLVNAVYCVNCDLITNSPHDDCSVCGSHSVIGVARMWQLALPETPVKAARYTVSFTANVRGIPAYGLSESTKLIGRLAELGGDLKELHIQVDCVSSGASVEDTGTRQPRPGGPTPFTVANASDHGGATSTYAA